MADEFRIPTEEELAAMRDVDARNVDKELDHKGGVYRNEDFLCKAEGHANTIVPKV